MAAEGRGRGKKKKVMAGRGRGKMDEMGCANEMKKLYASGCAKEAMYKKINAQYNCGREKFEKLYASNCG